MVDKEKEKSELYTELRNKDLLNKQEELDRVKSKIKDDLLSKEVDFYLNDIISNVIDDDYLNKLNTEINTLKDNLLS
ncbi:MAG: hypothetical protein QM532_04410 [Cyanobium sp. MAG06]|nr:hypothetical protein [Cyanobium sp. MAG06]